jgi:hypothetical protein
MTLSSSHHALVFVLLAASCSKTPETKAEPAPATSVAVAPAATTAPSASGSSRGGHHGGHEDRHDPAERPAALTLEVKIAGATKTWQKDAFDKVPKFALGSVGNDGEDRDTWSVRDLAHTLVGPRARVVAIVGPDETRTIDRAAWDDPARTPILHSTRRGTLKFRWADKAGKWSEAEVKDVSRLAIEP